MKLITAIIKPFKLEEVRTALTDLGLQVRDFGTNSEDAVDLGGAVFVEGCLNHFGDD